MDDTLQPILLTIKHDGNEADLNDTEIENTISSLRDKATLLLQEMNETNQKVKENKLKNKVF